MFKNILLSVITASMAFGAYAQDNLYLIKDNTVVAKYAVSDIDYATFKLPEGVVDPGTTPVGPGVQTEHYIGAAGTYYGTSDEIADFQVQLSTRPIYDENLPVYFLYLQFMAPAADYHDLKLNDGTYTLGDLDNRKPYTFYAGMREITSEGEAIGGTITVGRPDPETTTATLVTGGQFTITTVDKGYKIAGLLKLESGSVLEFDYEGACVIDNRSDEKDPADELPLPDSKLTSDVNLDITEAYATVWTKFFADMPRFDYVYMLMYTDDTYADFIQLGLIVDREKNPGVILPKGKYPVIKRVQSEFDKVDLAAIPAFQVVGDFNIADYGCWCAQGYFSNPLIAGEVEVLEDATDLKSVKIKINLKDNAETPHTVTATYEGALEDL